MKNVLNQLIQLQELNFALQERKASEAQLPLAQLEEAIAEIQKSLPEDVAARYARLQTNSPLAIVPILGMSCSRCGLAVSAAVVNATKASEALQSCPHCGRFLYYPEKSARQPKKKFDRDAPVLTGMARFSDVVLMVPQLTGTTKQEAIGELAHAMAKNGFIEDAETVTDLALQRETMVSTAVTHGLAFPHVRNVEGGGLTLALGLKEKGIDFGAADGKSTKIVFLMVIPPPATAFYLRLLAGLVRTFAETEARKALLECETPAAMWKALTKLTRQTVP